MTCQQRKERVYCPGLIYSAPAGKKGRGVFAAQNIKKGVLIEECEIIFFPKKEIPTLKKTQIDCYYYCWKGGAAALPLGFGPLYNHSSHANAEWRDDYRLRRMILFARKKIKKDEEITVNYNLGVERIWFPVVEDT